MNGGYIMIDWGGVELTSETAQTIAGIYSATKAALETGKMVVVTNCKDSGTALSPFPAIIKAGAEALVCTIPNYQITITNSNSVTVTSTIGG